MDYFKLGCDIVKHDAQRLTSRCNCRHQRWQHVRSEIKQSTDANPLYWCTAKVAKNEYCPCENFCEEE
jgi:hypothetical protein